jgi:5-methylcytosine-specific restriction endonuclease McrA
MSLVATFAKAIPKKPAIELSADEQKVVDVTNREAKTAGATLSHKNGGGVAPSLALGVFRRDEWKCVRCGSKTDLELHHLIKKDVTRNLVTLCAPCHDEVERAAQE